MRLGLYQPDIAQNTGTILRMAACLDVSVEIIQPAGFDVTDRAFRRAGMDYLDFVSIIRYSSWQTFRAAHIGGTGRIVLLTTMADCDYTDFAYSCDDILLLGRESAGVPDHVHGDVDAAVKIPMQTGMRSLNVAITAAMVLGEALRQTRS